MAWVKVMEGLQGRKKRRGEGGKKERAGQGRREACTNEPRKSVCVCVCTLAWCRENLPSKVK